MYKRQDDGGEHVVEIVGDAAGELADQLHLLPVSYTHLDVYKRQVVSRLGVRSLRIGGEIDPGVPWTYAEGGDAPLLLALKSGNFGARDFFLRAFEAPTKTLV